MESRADASVTGFWARSYARVHRVLLGSDPDSLPPRLLILLWALVAVSRAHTLFQGIDEDSVWCLETQVDQPWLVVFGLKDAFTLNHVVNTVLSSALLRATGWHWPEPAYHLPALLAGILTAPLAYMVFARAGGRACGIASSALLCILPPLALHSGSPRGYASLLLLSVWALGATPGFAGRMMPVRSGIAYFLLACSHGIGILDALCLGAVGCFTGRFRPAFRQFAANALLALPGFVYGIPMLISMRSERARMALQTDPDWLTRAGFLPKWFAYQFGAASVPIVAILFAALLAWGVWLLARRDRRAAFAMLALGLAIPAAFYAGSTFWTRAWYSMGCVGFWIWPIGLAAADLHARAGRLAWGRFALPAAFVLCAAALLPRTIGYLEHPSQDYLGAIRAVRERCPDQRVLPAFTDVGVTGMGYYARRYGMQFRWIRNGVPADSAALAILDSTSCFVSMGEPVSPTAKAALAAHAGDTLWFNGIVDPLIVHVAARH